MTARNPKILICICTRERDRLLSQAIAAIGRLERPADHDLELLVVENEPTARQAEAIAASGIGMTVHYRHEPALGLVNARNRALETAVEMGADWVAFTDDDQRVEPDWLTAYAAAIAQNPERRMLTGPYWYEYGADYSPFRPRQRDRADAEKMRLNTIMGGNCLIHRDVFGPQGLGLRFNLDFNFTGCEDTEYGLRAEHLGYPFLWVSNALVRETLNGHRATYRDQWIRAANLSSNVWRAEQSARGQRLSIWRALAIADKAIVFCCWNLLVGVVTGPFDRDRAWREIGRAGLRLAMLAALMRHFAGRHVDSYAKVRGR